MLDEPVGGLSSKETDELVRIINELREQGLTIIVVEHDMRFIMRLVDRITVLNFREDDSSGYPRRNQMQRRVHRRLPWWSRGGAQ